jgi:5'-3' exonuclease
MKFNIERIIDDFVFFCFFIGNDFLPSLSSLDIAEGSLDSLIDFYKQKYLTTSTDYITESGLIFWDRAEPFINLLGEHEHGVFKSRIDRTDIPKEKVISFTSGSSMLQG